MFREITLFEQGLWFDVERRYKTMVQGTHPRSAALWFDVERRYKTMPILIPSRQKGCGLM